MVSAYCCFSSFEGKHLLRLHIADNDDISSIMYLLSTWRYFIGYRFKLKFDAIKRGNNGSISLLQFCRIILRTLTLISFIFWEIILIVCNMSLVDLFNTSNEDTWILQLKNQLNNVWFNLYISVYPKGLQILV